MEELKVKAKVIALKHAEELAKELAVMVAFPALKLVVEKSETKIDDAVLMAMEEPLKAAVMQMLEQIYKEEA
jgi:hypothetical protein